MQDDINGGFAESWHKALKAISLFPQYLPKKDGFGELGRAMQSQNLHEIENIIRFGTEIGWHSSLVPIHVTDHSIPLGFRTMDQSLKFKEHEYAEVDALVEREHGGLVRIGGDRDHQLVENARGPPHQVGVTVGDGVEGAGIDGGSFVH